MYFGRALYGVEAATRGYFGGAAAGLSAGQAFFLAERIAAPNRFCIARIANLLSRPTVSAVLGAERHALADVYARVFGQAAATSLQGAIRRDR